MVVWLSISDTHLLNWDPRTPAFPAILDPGNNFTLSIFHSQLVQWAGIYPEALRLLGTIRESGNIYPRREADLWLHPNVPGRREIRSGGDPFRLSVAKGIVVYPDTASPAPHLPLLGLQALTENKLRTLIDGDRKQVTIRTPRRLWGLI